MNSDLETADHPENLRRVAIDPVSRVEGGGQGRLLLGGEEPRGPGRRGSVVVRSRCDDISRGAGPRGCCWGGGGGPPLLHHLRLSWMKVFQSYLINPCPNSGVLPAIRSVRNFQIASPDGGQPGMK